MTSYTEDKDTADIPISRTKKKKDDKLRQKLGEKLVGLPEKELERIGLSDEIMEEVLLARKTNAHGARRRQIKYIGGLLRGTDTVPIEKALEHLAQIDYENNFAFKKLENWRDQLKNGNMGLVDEILAECPAAERRQLSQLARNAKKEFEENRGTKASKALFRYLKEISES